MHSLPPGQDSVSLRFGNEATENADGQESAKPEEPSLQEHFAAMLAELLNEATSWMDKVNGLFQHKSPILEAVREGEREEVQKLLGEQHPDRIDCGNGRTLAMIAGLNHQNEILNDLLTQGANPQAKDERKQSLLSLMMTAQNYEGLLLVLNTLKSQNADLNTILNEPDEDGYTPLAWAVEQQDFAAAKIFLEAGAKPDVPEAGNTSPAYLADHLENGPMLQLLSKYK
jgi:ankyrin repeat protein